MITLGQPTSRRLAMPWRNGIAIGRAFELVRSDLVAHLAHLQRTIGYRFCRFHAVFDDDMHVAVRAPDGTIAYSWRNVDLVYDQLLAIGLKPFVELNPMPAALASSAKTVFAYRMNVSPPTEVFEWEALIEAFARHLISRYGAAEVRSWYFEVWNEPNLKGFWTGVPEDYFRIYDAAARALKRVDPGLRVGGPATARAAWLEEMIDHCATSGVPLDFVSTHLYPQDEYVVHPDRAGCPYPPGDFFTRTVAAARERIRQRLAAHGLPPLEIHWTEWNAMTCGGGAPQDWVSNPTNDSLHGAAFVARTCLALDDQADTLCWWAASDVFGECGLPVSPYSMSYGLLTIHGIPKPAFQAFALLRRLSGDIVPAERGDQAPAAAGVAATGEGDATDVLLWNQRLLEDAAPRAWTDRIAIPVNCPAEQLVVAARVGAGHGSAYEAWLAMGAPQDLSPAAEAVLRAHAEPAWTAQRLAPVDGRIVLDIRLEPGEVLYLHLQPVGQVALPRSLDSASLAQWNATMGDPSH